MCDAVSPSLNDLSQLIDMPHFFEVCNHAFLHDVSFLERMPVGWGAGEFLTSTFLEVGNTGVRVRSGFDPGATTGWSELAKYPWTFLMKTSFRKKERFRMEKHPLFEKIFGERTRGLYGFGWQYARESFNLELEGVANQLETRYVASFVDMAPADGEHKGTISICFKELPLTRTYAGIFKVKP